MPSTIPIPVQRPLGWLPAWDAKFPGTTVVRTLDAGDWLAATGGRTLLDAAVTAAGVTVSAPLINETAVTVYVGGGDPAAGSGRVTFALSLSDGTQDTVVAVQPVRTLPLGAAPASATLAPAFVLRGPWQPATPYNANDVLQYDGSTYVVRRGFTSGSMFDPTPLLLWAAKGDPGAPGASVPAPPAAGTVVLSVDGAGHIVAMLPDGSMATVVQGAAAMPPAAAVTAADLAALAASLPTAPPSGAGQPWLNGLLIAWTAGTAPAAATALTPALLAAVLAALPTAAPSGAGQPWNNGGWLSFTPGQAGAGTTRWTAADLAALLPVLPTAAPAAAHQPWSNGRILAIS